MRPTLVRIILFVVSAGLVLLVGNRFSAAPQGALVVVSLLIGAAGFALAIVFADKRLRRRGKNGFWLLLFFGPLVAGAKLFELVPGERTELKMIALLAVCIVAAPFFLWGLAELSARD